MKIAIGSDHAGFRYKQEIIMHLQSAGHDVTDFGTDSETPVSYVTFIRPVAQGVAAGIHEDETPAHHTTGTVPPSMTYSVP